MVVLEIVGSILFAFLFINSGINHLINRDYLAGYAASKKVPFPKFVTVATGILLIVAPVLFILNIVPVIALSFLAVFLFFAAVVMHDFWRQADEATKVTEQIQFSKDLSLLGAVLIMITLIV